MEISEIYPGDVLFVWGKGIIEECIEFVTHGPSHCAIFIDNQTIAEAQWGRVTGTSLLSDYLSSDSHLEVWGDETLTDDDREEMVIYAKSHFGIPYNKAAIFAELVHFEIGIPLDRWNEGKNKICSFYVNDCAKSVNKIWAKVNAPAPVDLLEGGKLTRKGALTCPNIQVIPNA